MSVARPNVQEDIGKLRSIRYINFYHLYLWFNQPALGFLEGSWNSSLCVEIFQILYCGQHVSLGSGSCKTFSQNSSLTLYYTSRIMQHLLAEQFTLDRHTWRQITHCNKRCWYLCVKSLWFGIWSQHEWQLCFECRGWQGFLGVIIAHASSNMMTRVQPLSSPRATAALESRSCHRPHCRAHSSASRVSIESPAMRLLNHRRAPRCFRQRRDDSRRARRT